MRKILAEGKWEMIQIGKILKRLGPNSGIVILSPFIIIFGGVGIAYIESTMHNISHGSLSSRTPLSTFSTSHKVTYKVTGSTPTATLTLIDVGGFNQGIRSQLISNVPLPWSQTLTLSFGTTMFLSAQNDHRPGNVQVEIDVDGVPWKKSHSEGGHSLASATDLL